jgi:proliferating cell nuclear antigen
MFEMKTKAKNLKEIYELIRPLVDEGKLNIKKNGFSLRAVDPAHVGMVDLDIKDKAFDEYKATDMELGVDFDKLNSFLRLTASENLVQLKYDEDTNRLICTDITTGITRRMGLIDSAGMPDPKIPNLNLPALVTAPADRIKLVVRAAGSLSDHIIISADKDTLVMSAEGDTDDVELKLKKDECEKFEVKNKNKSLISIDYLENAVKPLKDKITLNFGNDNPLKMEFTFGENDAGKGIYLIAPRIESE